MRHATDVVIAACSAAFVIVLTISAYWDPSIRVLHTFEALPYVAVIVLCLRRIRFGYALGFAAGIFWLWSATFLTTFVRNGFELLAKLIRTGTLDRPDVLIAAPAAIATGGLALSSLAGYAQQSGKSWRDALLFLGALVLFVGFFIGILAAFAPGYLEMFRPLLRR